MSRHDDQASLSDMLSHAREAVAAWGTASADDLAGNRQMQLALTHLVQIDGEAANRVSSAAQQHPKISWPKIIGVRSHPAHGCDDVD